MCDKYLDSMEKQTCDNTKERYCSRKGNSQLHKYDGGSCPQNEKGHIIEPDGIPATKGVNKAKEISPKRISHENSINSIVENRNALMRNVDRYWNTNLQKMLLEITNQDIINRAIETLKNGNSFKPDISFQNLHGHSLLFVSILARNLTSTLALLRNGAPINQVDNERRTIFHYLAERNAEYYASKIFKEFTFPTNETSQVLKIWDKEGVTPIQLAVLEGNMEAFHYFYNIGGDQLYQKDKKKGYTLLHMSAEKGNEFLVDMLLNKKDEEIDINEQAPDEATPLHLAVAHGHINIVESLLDAGAIATIFMREYSIMGLIPEECEREMLGLFSKKLRPGEYCFLDENMLEVSDTDDSD